MSEDNLSRQIYLAGALGRISTESAARAILAGLPAGEPILGPRQRSSRIPKTLGKKEKKKRSAQRKAQKRRKKK